MRVMNNTSMNSSSSYGWKEETDDLQNSSPCYSDATKRPSGVIPSADTHIVVQVELL